ncbi:MAG: hypothetical protein JNM17_17815, partial [Archangium sp.]|nr:hypothetical protein [Archangium sp.]
MHAAPGQLDLFSRAPLRASTPTRPSAAKPSVADALTAARETAPYAATPIPVPVAREVEPPVPAGLLPLPSRQQTLQRARQLAERIATFLGPDLKVHLAVHDNRSTMISFRRQPPLVRIRVHHMFLDAPDAVVKSIADYAGRGKHAAGTV